MKQKTEICAGTVKTIGENSMKKQIVELKRYEGKKNTKKFLSSEIEGDVIVFENSNKPVPQKYLFDIRILRIKGPGAKTKLEDGKILEIISFYEGKNVGKTVVKITGNENG